MGAAQSHHLHAADYTPETASLSTADVGGLPRKALMAGFIGLLFLGLLFAVAFFHRELLQPVLQCYLLGFMYWFNIVAGSLFLLMLQYLSGGAWGLIIRRVLEASTRTLFVTIPFFIPIALGMPFIYEWHSPDPNDRVLMEKIHYLNPTFWLIRAGVVFAILSVLVLLLNKFGAALEKTGDSRFLAKAKNTSGPGIVLFFLLMTVAGVDWMMSLEPHWFSHIYGVLVMIGQVLAAHAFTIAAIIILARYRPMVGIVNQDHLHDLGKLLLAFTMLWAYVNFSQLLIIWAGNLAEEVPWYIKRFERGYAVVGISLIAFHFFAPFLLLLSRPLKRDPRMLIFVCVWILIMRFVDLFFLITPASTGSHGGGDHHEPLNIFVYAAIALTAWAGIGGIWLSQFLRQITKRPLLPLNDPYLEEGLNHHVAH